MINNIPDLLKTIQKMYPGLRIGQIICNAVEDGADCLVDESYIFYISDSELEQRLKTFMKKYGKGIKRVPERR